MLETVLHRVAVNVQPLAIELNAVKEYGEYPLTVQRLLSVRVFADTVASPITKAK
jgi:hypothetical protein